MKNEAKEIILQAENVHFSYDGELNHSLNGLSLKIEKGKKIAVMGANGSGKSTFFLCCNGINRPDSGTISFHGQPLDYSKKGLLDLRSKIGIIFQDPDHQLFSASVHQEISFGILNLGVPAEQANDAVESVIDQLEITPFRHKPTHALSGGQKKQVSIADILVMHPEMIILDEPTAALDPKHEQMVHDSITQLTKEGITVLLSTHDADYALEWADEVILFCEGQVLAQGTPSQVFSNQAALAMTNLNQPAVMQIFERLCQKGILSTSLQQPKNLKELTGYLESLPLHGPATHSATHLATHSVSSNSAHATTYTKAILVVSFGTSHNETRAKTIDQIEQDIAHAFPDYHIYRAWTSQMIIAKIKKRDHISIPTVAEAMEQMAKDGITDVIVQPTHVINGIENEQMQLDALSCPHSFSSIQFGDPLLTSKEDNLAVINAIADSFPDLSSDHALVLMGHGTTHYANAIYAALDYQFKDAGHPNIFLGTVEAYPSMETLLKMVTKHGASKVTLAPFMIVAGDHATHDMAGDDPDSWFHQFKNAGFSVDCVMKGLGEYPAIRKIILNHIDSKYLSSQSPLSLRQSSWDA